MSEKEPTRIEKAIPQINAALRQLTFSTDPRALRAIQKLSEALSILTESK